MFPISNGMEENIHIDPKLSQSVELKTPKNRPKIFGLEKNTFVLGLVSFFNDFSQEMILSIFPAFFQSVLKSGAASLGIIEGIADGFSNFVKIYSGRLSDKLQKRKSIAIIGYTISVFVRPFYLIAGTAGHVLGIRVVDRIGKGLREAPRDALISLSVDEKELGKSFGYHRAMDTFGAILGPLVAFFILRSLPGDFDTIFFTAFIIGILAIFSFVFVREVKGAIQRDKILLSFKVHSKNFKLLLLSLAILSVGNIPMAVLLLRTQDLGLDISYIPLFYLFYNVSFTIFAFFAGKAADTMGDRKIIFIGYSLLCISYMLMIYDESLTALALGFIILGVFAAFTEGVQRSYLARLTKKEHRGSAYGLMNASIGFGAIFAGVIGGSIWQAHGAISALTLAVVIILIGLIVFLFHKPKQGEEM